MEKSVFLAITRQFMIQQFYDITLSDDLGASVGFAEKGNRKTWFMSPWRARTK